MLSQHSGTAGTLQQAGAVSITGGRLCHAFVSPAVARGKIALNFFICVLMTSVLLEPGTGAKKLVLIPLCNW